MSVVETPNATAHKPTAQEQNDFDARLITAVTREASVPIRRAPGGQPVAWSPQDGSQKRFMATPYFEALYHGTRGPGKDVNLDTLILTNKGWVEAGKITYDHKLVARDGSYTKLLGIYPKTDRPMRLVTFHDGATVIADAEHRWLVLNNKTGYREGWKVRTTDQMMNVKVGYSIPFLDAPWEGLNRWAGPDPYTVGLMLGDGTMRSERVTLYSADEEIMEHAASLGWNRYHYPNQVMRAVCPEAIAGQWRYIMPPVYAEAKAVPTELMTADPASRLAVLQGLMDSDGSIEKDGKQSFCSNSKQLATNVVELYKSLGGFGAIRLEERVQSRLATVGRMPNGNRWRVSLRHNNKFTPFRLKRKVERLTLQKKYLTRGIKSIEPHGTADGVCFAVEHEDHLFVCGDWVLTHNTDALLMAFAIHVERGYGAAWRGVIFRQTYPQLADVVAKSEKWFRQMWPSAKFNKSNMTWTWPTGEVLMFRHMARAADYWNYHGHEYPFIGWEELTNWADDTCYKSMFACCRSSTVGVPRMVRATTNPYGTGHGWVKLRWKLHGRWWTTITITDAKDMAGNPEPARVAIHGHLKENKILLAANPDYIMTLTASAANQEMLKAWQHGSWNIVAGGMFSDVWAPRVNVLPVFQIPFSWKIDRSFDWGSSAPFSVGWWAESDGSDLHMPGGKVLSTVRGDLFRIHEWYGWSGKPNQGLQMLATEVAKGIVERELAWGIQDRVRAGPADNSIFDVQNGMSIGVDMAKPVRIGSQMYRGVQWTRSDKSAGSRKTGWEQMRTMMKSARHKKGLPRENPGLFVTAECEHFLRTVIPLPRSEKDMDDVDTNAEDHVGDETRYRVRFCGQSVGTGSTVGMY